MRVGFGGFLFYFSLIRTMDKIIGGPLSHLVLSPLPVESSGFQRGGGGVGVRTRLEF